MKEKNQTEFRLHFHHIRDSIIALNKFMEGTEPLAYFATDYERAKLSEIYEDCTILSAHKPIQRRDFSFCYSGLS